jgi:CBS domain containing-hemolysin-like protein
MLGKLERLAQVGDVVVIDGIRLRVEDLDGFRIARISIQPLTSPDQQSNTDTAPE